MKLIVSLSTSAALFAASIFLLATSSASAIDITGPGDCNGPQGCNSQGGCDGQGVYKTYYPTRVCNWDEGSPNQCTQRQSYYLCYKEWLYYSGNCLPIESWYEMHVIKKDWACSGTTP